MVTASTFVGNSAKVGGAISSGGNRDPLGGYLTLTECTLSGNTAGSGGGGIFASTGYTALTNCTIANNEAPTGAGLDVTLYAGRIDPFSLANTIVAGNDDGSTPDDINGPVTAHYNLIGASSNATFLGGSGNNLLGVTNPGMGTLASHGGPTQTIGLLPGSPAIDAGSNALALLLKVDQADTTGMTGAVPLATDPRGLARIVGGTVDIGADEYQADFGVTSASAPAVTYTGGSLTEMLTVADQGPDASAPVLTDVIPAGTVVQSWTTNASGWILTIPVVGGQVTATASLLAGQALAAGASATFTLTLEVTALGGTVLADSAAVGPTSHDTNLANNITGIVQNSVGLGVSSIAAVVPNPRDQAVSSIDVTLDEPVNLGAFPGSALTLTDNGGPNLITGAVTASPVSGSTYQINGLGGLTTANGTYIFTVNAADIRDRNGVAGLNALSTSWLMDTTPPTSTVSPLPKVGTSLVFPVTVTGTVPNEPVGSPTVDITSFAVYVSTNGGAWSLWQTLTPTSGKPNTASANYTGTSNTVYAFYTVATDNAGNAQPFKPTVEASTDIPNLNTPATLVTSSSLYNGDGTFTLSLTGTDSGGSGLAYFEVFVAIGAGTPVLIGPAVPAGVANSSGTYQATSTYVVPSNDNGPSNTYQFYSVGIDAAGLAEPFHTMYDASFTVSYKEPMPANLTISSLTVENGAVERSYIRYLELNFNDANPGVLQAIVNSVNDPTDYGPPELTLTQNNLTGSGVPTTVTLQGLLSVIDNAIEIDFGPGGIGGNPSTTTADGYYTLTFAPPVNRGISSTHHFDRLLGDVNGDGIVDQNDLNEIAAARGQSTSQIATAINQPASGLTALSMDVNGDGSVNTNDVALATKSTGNSLKKGLTLV